jgi:hypothetical protein
MSKAGGKGDFKSLFELRDFIILFQRPDPTEKLFSNGENVPP